MSIWTRISNDSRIVEYQLWPFLCDKDALHSFISNKASYKKWIVRYVIKEDAWRQHVFFNFDPDSVKVYPILSSIHWNNYFAICSNIAHYECFPIKDLCCTSIKQFSYTISRMRRNNGDSIHFESLYLSNLLQEKHSDETLLDNIKVSSLLAIGCDVFSNSTIIKLIENRHSELQFLCLDIIQRYQILRHFKTKLQIPCPIFILPTIHDLFLQNDDSQSYPMHSLYFSHIEESMNLYFRFHGYWYGEPFLLQADDQIEDWEFSSIRSFLHIIDRLIIDDVYVFLIEHVPRIFSVCLKHRKFDMCDQIVRVFHRIITLKQVYIGNIVMLMDFTLDRADHYLVTFMTMITKKNF